MSLCGSLTFSAYLYTTGVSCRIGLHDYLNHTESCDSETVTTASQWTRVQVTYTNDTESNQHFNAALFLEDAGTVYMDGVQVEKTASASRLNLVDNGDFRNGFYGWVDNSGAIVSTDSAAASNMDTNAHQIVGVPTYTRMLSQTLSIGGLEGDCFVISGWAKGDSAPLTDEREFGIRLIFHYTYGGTGEFAATFNPDMDSSSWQYAAKAAVAERSYSSVTVQLAYDYNVNTVYFDGIQLYKEEFGSSYTYDSDGKVISVKDLQAQNTEYEYTGNDLTKIIQDGSAKMTYEYDNYHNVKTATTDEGLSYSFEYDTYGNNTKVSTTSNGKTMQSSAVYSSNGNYLASTTDALGKQTTYNYDPDTGVLDWVQYPEDTENTRTEYTYDSMYRMATAACTTDTGLNLSAEYTYSDDLLTSIETPSTTYNFSYGDFDLRTGVSIGNRTLATYNYTTADRKYNLSGLDYGNGDSVNYAYDDKDRVTKQTYEDGTYITYFYDNDGALARTYDSQSGITASYTYDLTGRPMKHVESGSNYSHSVGYEYDDLNNLTKQVETTNGTERTATYTYDADNRVKTSTTNGITVEYAYDDFGRVETQVTKSGSTTILTESFTYKTPASEAISAQIVSYSTATPSGYSVIYSYTYDDNGNITSIFDGTYTTTYAYDSANQLYRENNQARNYTYIWHYDDAGNITKRLRTTYTAGNLSSLSSDANYTYGDSQWGDLLTEYDGNAITYDEIGNPLSDGTWNYTWQHGRQLAAMTKGNTTWTYTYDANGMRTSKSNGSGICRYIYNGSQLTRMTRGSHVLDFTYDANGTPLTLIWNGTTYYYVTNLQGDVTAILDGSGTMVVRYQYDAWGKALSISGSLLSSLGSLNPLRYRGYVYDTETGLYYLQSRYYNPETGRFLNADAYTTTGQGFIGNNMFAYCLNNPVNFVDYDGENAAAILAWWSGGMGWLCLADLTIPIGDLVYGLGVISLSLVVVLTNTGSTNPVIYQNIVSDSNSGSSSPQASAAVTGGASSPKPPKKGKGELSFSKNFSAKRLYNKNGISVDYEYNGNGTGNVHIHKSGQKYHYDNKGYLRMGPNSSDPLAPTSIQRLLRDAEIFKAIIKGLKNIRELGGY